MSGWYYHQQPQGRVGPLSAEQLRMRFDAGHLHWESLVWREGMAEWQSLALMAGELGISLPAAAVPPPLPPAASASRARAPDPLLPPPALRERDHQPAVASAPRSGLGGCAIAAIVLAVVAVPLVGILAAIALPAYQDYTVRAKVAAALAQAPALQAAVIEHHQRTGECAEEGAEGFAPTPRAADGGAIETAAFGRLADGRCAFELTLAGIGPQADGLTVLYAAPATPGDATGWDCQGGTLPARYRPIACRAATP